MSNDPGMVVPDYGGASLDGVVPAIFKRRERVTPWLPDPVVDAEQVVLLVLDGLGWHQLQERGDRAPTLCALTGGPITTVIPSTTATALTSLVTGARPAEHGVVGYRVRVAGTEVLNVLRWSTAAGDARALVPPAEFQHIEPFGGSKPPVVHRAELADSGFTAAHLAGVRHFGWRMPSTLVGRVERLLAEGERFLYAYYDGVDKVAHEFGLGRMYDLELSFADRLVESVIEVLPPSAALVVTSDHGQVEVGDRVVAIHPEVDRLTASLSGEGRFRWLHARPGRREALLEAATARHSADGWVRSREQAVAAGWFGGPLAPEVESRLGDVVLAAHRPVAFVDPNDTGEVRLVSRHGSLTPEEMLVPLVATRR